MSQVKVKVVYCHCGQSILAACVMPVAEKEARWIAVFDYYWELGYRVGLMDGPVTAGKCNCNSKQKTA